MSGQLDRAVLIWYRSSWIQLRWLNQVVVVSGPIASGYKWLYWVHISSYLNVAIGGKELTYRQGQGQ